MCGFKLKFIIITVNSLNNLWYTRNDANKHLFSRYVCGKMQIHSFIINTFGDMSVNKSAKKRTYKHTKQIIQRNWFFFYHCFKEEKHKNLLGIYMFVRAQQQFYLTGKMDGIQQNLSPILKYLFNDKKQYKLVYFQKFKRFSSASGLCFFSTYKTIVCKQSQ